MVFQFEHMDLDGGETFKWNEKKDQADGIKAGADKMADFSYGKGMEQSLLVQP